MNSEVKTEEGMQAVIDSLPDQHNAALYEAVILDKYNEFVTTKLMRTTSPEKARLIALKKCRFEFELDQAAYANLEMMSCQGSAFNGWSH